MNEVDALDFRHPNFSLTKKAIYDLACKLFPLPRSITGEGLRTSLQILKAEYEMGGGGGVNS